MEISDRILNLLEKKTYGLSIEEISGILSINRTTTSKYLLVLESRRKISVRILGKAKLHYPRSVKL